MKRIAFLLSSVLLFACSSKKESDPNATADLKPQSVKVSGYLSDYLEVVDGSYKLERDNAMIFSWIVKVKVKAKAAYNEDDYGLKDGNNGPLYLSVNNLQQAPVTGLDHLPSDYTSDSKLVGILKAGTGEVWVTFSEFHNMDNEKMPDGVAGFTISSEKKEASANADNGNEDRTSASTTSGKQDWDKLITDYESYMKQYISLMQKAADGDQSAMTEYPAMMQKANEVAQDIQSAGTDITPEQLAKFSKLQTDLMAEAMKVQAKMKK